jgi:hypothetical protein
MKKPAPRTVGELLPSALPQIADRLLELHLRQAWPSLVGRDTARRSRPDAFAGGTLRVTVDNSPWLHELTLRAAEITANVRASFPAVLALRFVLGAVPSDAASVAPKRPRPVALTPADHADIDAAAAAISDSGLADAARRLLVTARRFPRTQAASRGAV